VLVALFVWMGAAAEANSIQFHSTLGGVPVERVMIRDVRTLAPSDTLAVAVDHVLSGFQQDFPVVENGRVVGVLTRASLLMALTRHGATAPVREAMDASFSAADPREPVDDAFARLAECRCRSMPVVRNGELVGVLTSENIGEYVMVESALSRRGGDGRTRREVIV
jgi:CBS domain-containing protein